MGPSAFALTSTYVSASAAASATATLDTGEGRKAIGSIAEEFFDDVLGMHPNAACITSSIALHTALTLGYEATFSNLVANPAKDKVAKRGIDTYDAKRLPPEGFKTTQITALTDKSDNAIALIGKRPTRSSIFTHYSAATENFSADGVIPVMDKDYGMSWGGLATCQQMTNRTLLDAGISNTILGESWDTYVTTIVYGNYGGGTATKAATGIMNGNNYEDR